LHALAKFPILRAGPGKKEELQAAFAIFVPEIIRKTDAFTVQNLAMIVHAFSLIDFRDPELLRVTLSVLLARRSTWNAQDVAVLSSSLSRMQHFCPDTFNSLAKRVPHLISRFKVGELATVLNALAHYARQDQADARFNEAGQNAKEADLRRAFESAEQFVSQKDLATSSVNELVILLNSFAKMQLAVVGPASATLAEIDVRVQHTALSVASASMVLNALSQLQRQPSAILLNSFRTHPLRSDGKGPWNNLDIVRAVSITSALSNLDLASRDLPMRLWTDVLLQYLCCALRNTGPSAWTWRLSSLAAALDSVSMIWCSCQKSSCHLCSLSWWRTIEILLEQALQLARAPKSHTEDKYAQRDPEATKRTRRALLAIIGSRVVSSHPCPSLQTCKSGDDRQLSLHVLRLMQNLSTAVFTDLPDVSGQRDQEENSTHAWLGAILTASGYSHLRQANIADVYSVTTLLAPTAQPMASDHIPPRGI